MPMLLRVFIRGTGKATPEMKLTVLPSLYSNRCTVFCFRASPALACVEIVLDSSLFFVYSSKRRESWKLKVTTTSAALLRGSICIDRESERF
jgi:hypothetical protein